MVNEKPKQSNCVKKTPALQKNVFKFKNFRMSVCLETYVKNYEIDKTEIKEEFVRCVELQCK